MLPEEMQRANERRFVIKSLVTTACLLFLVVLSIHLLLAAGVGRLERVERELASMGEPPEISQLRKETARLELEMQGFINKNRVPLDILSKHLPCPYILKTIGDITLDMVWLTGFSVDSQKGTSQIDGRSFNNKLVSEFMLELKKLPYFKSVELTSMERNAEPEKIGVEFKITCKFN